MALAELVMMGLVVFCEKVCGAIGLSCSKPDIEPIRWPGFPRFAVSVV